MKTVKILFIIVLCISLAGAGLFFGRKAFIAKRDANLQKAVVTLFMGGFDTGSAGAVGLSIGKYVLVLVLVILIKNTNPRVRIDQAMKFFWVYCGIALVIAVILATIGSAYKISWL